MDYTTVEFKVGDHIMTTSGYPITHRLTLCVVVEVVSGPDGNGHRAPYLRVRIVDSCLPNTFHDIYPVDIAHAVKVDAKGWKLIKAVHGQQ